VTTWKHSRIPRAIEIDWVGRILERVCSTTLHTGHGMCVAGAGNSV
jgi:hypothetical protein